MQKLKTKFKETEIGMIPEDWEVGRLGDHIKLIKGISYRSKDYCSESEGKIFINLKCVARNGGFRKEGIKYYKGELKEDQFAKPGDILIANTDLTQNREVIGSPMRIPHISSDKEMCFSLDLSKIEVTSNKLDSDFLYFYLMSPYARNFMVSSSNGTTVVHLSTKNVPNMPTPLPKLNEQMSIAKFLSSLDKKIKLDSIKIDILSRMIQKIFDHWFFHNSELEGKDIEELDKFIKIIKGKKPLNINQEYKEGYLSYILIDVLNGANPDYVDPIKMMIVNKDEPIMVMDGASSGRVEIGHKGVLGSTLAKIISKNNNLKNSYIYHFLKKKEFDLNKNTTGTSIPHTDKGRIKKYEITFPEKDLMNKFETLHSEIIQKLDLYRKEANNLFNIKKLLLPKLIFGKISIV